jgi:ParB family chromosome partitioning protein
LAEQGAVPCLVRPDLAAADATAEVITALVENTQRLALTTTDLARGYEQLAIAGLSATRIAKAVGHKPGHVRQALAVAGCELATAAADRYDLTLEQAAVLAEFSDDREAVKCLVAVAKQDPRRWDHTVSRLLEDRKAVAAHAAAVRRLTDAGVAAVEHPDRSGGPARPIANLVDADGNVLDAAAHAACPGHAAAVARWDPGDVTYYCVDPAAHGHHDRWGRTNSASTPATVNGKMTEEAKAARRAVIDLNRQWRAAEPVRRGYIRDLLARRSPPKAALRFAVTEILGNPDRDGDGADSLLADLFRQPEPGSSYGRRVGAAAAANVGEGRLPLLLLAQVAADVEASMTEATWRNANPRAARWFRFLASTGYTLADIEQKVVDDATNTPGGTDAEGDGPDNADPGIEDTDQGEADQGEADQGETNPGDVGPGDLDPAA